MVDKGIEMFGMKGRDRVKRGLLRQSVAAVAGQIRRRGSSRFLLSAQRSAHVFRTRQLFTSGSSSRGDFGSDHRLVLL